MRILVEASTESEWVAQQLEELGHEVIVADPNYGLMYGHRSRRVKTDRRDVIGLVAARQHGTYRRAHRRSARQHEVQCRLNVRREMVEARTRAISLTRSITRGMGLRVRGGRTETFLTRLAALEMPSAMTMTLSPLCHVINVLDQELAIAEAQFEALVASDPIVNRLTTLPCIGPITASAFVAALDVASRFESAGQVTSYLGLVPQEYSSGEKQRRGAVMHIQRCSHCWYKRPGASGAPRIPRTTAFRTWALGVARRRGTKVAMVALARRLARTLFAMWRDETAYEPARIRIGRSTGDGAMGTTAAASV
jgi:transposase